MSYFDDKDLRQVDNLELLAKQVVEGFIIGLHKSPFHGFSVEFAEHRLYNPGESTDEPTQEAARCVWGIIVRR